MAYASATSSGAAFKDRYLPILSLVLGALGVLLGLVVITAPIAFVLGILGILTAVLAWRGGKRPALAVAIALGVIAVSFGIVGLVIGGQAVQIHGDLTDAINRLRSETAT